MSKLKYALALLIAFGLSFAGSAQIVEDPTTWTYEVKKKSGNQYELIFHLKLQEHWHIWSLNPGGDGLQIPPSFTFKKGSHYSTEGKVKENGKPVTEEIDGIDGKVTYFLNGVDYTQTVRVTGNGKIEGKHKYQVCNESMCLPPKSKSFSFEIKDAAPAADTTAADTTQRAADSPAVAVVPPADTSIAGPVTAQVVDTPGKSGDKMPQQQSLLLLFALSLAGGLLAVTTPCVYSMIPITVSFFTKRSKTRQEGIRNAIFYSLSIIIIFTVLGVALSLAFGGDVLYRISTHWLANMFFFIIFVIFGISFLGAFELTLPSSWTSKTDAKANTQSFKGIFFMALTLVIVSFSCTGPIVGPLIVAASKGGIVGPAIGLFGFSLGLALPFSLLAIFPSLMNKMASSGGWLNQVKVTLGIIELALAMKFLSNADLVMGWRLLDREIFIAIWVILFLFLGFYLMGKFKMPKDDGNAKNVFGQEYVSIFKFFLALGSFTFALYLLPGMWGAPLKGMGQFLPPMGTFDQFGGSGTAIAAPHGSSAGGPVKYTKEMALYEPDVVKKNGLVTYYDYEEALAAGKAQKKPVMLDFTGITCVNCRKMETQVWSSPEVMKRLKEDFIVASLYCDASVDLVKGDEYVSKERDVEVATLGDKSLDIQITKFNSNTQPFYFFVDENGTKLAENGYPYDPAVSKFVDHLERVKAKYKELHP